MNNSKSKGLIIDFVILTIICILLIVGLYTTYEIFPKLPRLVAVLQFFGALSFFQLWAVKLSETELPVKKITNKLIKKKNILVSLSNKLEGTKL